jgi:glutamate carboxypeptidase
MALALPGTDSLKDQRAFGRRSWTDGRTAAVAGLFTRASEVASSLGRVLREGPAGGGSDGNFTAALGVPTLDGLGATGDGAHAAHEHVDVSALPWRAALVAGLLASFRL